jgi:DNA-binding IscR family transcriptional regulator
MRISSKGRYALVSMIYMAQNYDREIHNSNNISEKVGISKIYLNRFLLF